MDSSHKSRKAKTISVKTDDDQEDTSTAIAIRVPDTPPTVIMVKPLDEQPPATPHITINNFSAPPAQNNFIIQINIPGFKRLSLERSREIFHKLKSFMRRRWVMRISLVILSLAIVLFVIHGIIIHNRNVAAAKAIAAGRVQQAKPTFQPVVPSNHQSLAVPDGTHSRFDSSRGSYDFIDSIKGQSFTVSEQQLGSSTAAQYAVGQAAQSLSANHQIKTKWGTAYVFSSQRYSSQQLVFACGRILSFIQSSNIIDDDDWVSYINSLN